MSKIRIINLVLIAAIIGGVSGITIGGFLILLEKAIELNLEYYLLILFLPLSGMFMNTLGRNSKRLLNLINNIIDTSKIDSGTYKLNKEELDIVTLVEDTALSMVEFAKSKI